MDFLSTTTETAVEAVSSTNEYTWILAVGFVVAFFLAFGVGANDVANSFGTSVGAKVLTLRQACILATIFETLGAVLIGYKVSNTVRKGIFDVTIYQGDEKTLMLGCLSALLGSAVWNILATALALPISGTHSIVGAMAGFTIVAKGIGSINWVGMAKIVASWFVSPALSGALSAAIFLIIYKLIIKSRNPIKNGLISLPFFYFVTLFVNFISVLFDGPQVLKFDLVPIWASVIISTLLALAAAIFVWCFLVPKLKAKIEDKRLPTKGMFKKSSSSTPTDTRECHINVAFEQNEVASNGASIKQLSVQEASSSPIKTSGEVDQLFSFLQVLTAIFGSFAHGGNDVSNAIGPLVSLWLIYSEGGVHQEAETPIWILLFGGLGICVGLWLYGRKVIKTVGESLTKISPSSGFAIEVGAASTVLLASKIGLPISTTHCKVGSIVTVGFFDSNNTVNWGLFKGIIAAWVLTLPITGGLSGLIMFVLQSFA